MEIWKPLRNFPSYNGSTEGRIMNVRTQHILKPYIDEKGRPTVCLRKNNRKYTVKVHKLIADTFLGERVDMEVRHRDENLLNNRIDNLKWVERARPRVSTKGTTVRVIETGDVYNSVSSCANDLRCCRSDIFKQLVGTIPHVKGYHFERI
jgi:hypothetical protein